MRIIAGRHKGARISAPRGAATRPTSDRAREAAFSLTGPVDGADVLDLYAGSGAMGLEALSRGAGTCVFVESDREACSAIEANVRRLGAAGATVRRVDAVRALAEDGRVGRTYDLVLADPPYDAWGDVESRLGEGIPRVLGPHALLVVESPARIEPSLPLHLVTSRRYGSARITLFRR